MRVYAEAPRGQTTKPRTIRIVEESKGIVIEPRQHPENLNVVKIKTINEKPPVRRTKPTQGITIIDFGS